MQYASGTHTQQQVALKVQESIKQKKDSDYEDDVLFLHVKEIVKSIKSSLVVIPVDMGVYANLPLLNLQGNLFVDIERLRIYHTPHCKVGRALAARLLVRTAASHTHTHRPRIRPA